MVSSFTGLRIGRCSSGGVRTGEKADGCRSSCSGYPAAARKVGRSKVGTFSRSEGSRVCTVVINSLLHAPAPGDGSGARCSVARPVGRAIVGWARDCFGVAPHVVLSKLSYWIVCTNIL